MQKLTSWVCERKAIEGVGLPDGVLPSEKPFRQGSGKGDGDDKNRD